MNFPLNVGRSYHPEVPKVASTIIVSFPSSSSVQPMAIVSMEIISKEILNGLG
jgi:hypothetical protein